MLGISASSKANLLSQLGAEANLLTVSAGSGLDGSPAPLPLTAEPMVARIPPVESVTAIGYVPGATVRRTSMVPVIDTGGISVLAAQPGLLGTLGGAVSHGTFLNAATRATRPWCSARSPPGPSASTGWPRTPRCTWPASTSR